MSTEIDFQVDWLNERFPFDCDARNKQVEQACLNFFKEKDSLNIIDIGAGTGSSLIYLADRIDQNQIWTLVELNPELLEAAKERIQESLPKLGFQLQSTDQCLHFQKEDKQLNIQFKHGSFLELEHILDLSKIDLITAGAVFDLLSRVMITEFVAMLKQNKISLLSTINYEGMLFEPKVEADKFYVQQYENHMHREQAFGQAIGTEASAALANEAKANNCIYVRGESLWEIGTEASKMHHHLLNYMESGVKAMLENNSAVPAFEAWLENKHQLVDQQELRQTVFHQDIFIAI